MVLSVTYALLGISFFTRLSVFGGGKQFESLLACNVQPGGSSLPPAVLQITLKRLSSSYPFI